MVTGKGGSILLNQYNIAAAARVLGAVIPFQGPSMARPALIHGASHGITAPKTLFRNINGNY